MSVEWVTAAYINEEKFPLPLNLPALLSMIFIRVGSNSYSRFPINVHQFNEMPFGISKCFLPDVTVSLQLNYNLIYSKTLEI